MASSASRPLERAVGYLVLVVALAISALVGLGVYRLANEAIRYRFWPKIGNLLFLLSLVLIGTALWVLTARLFRGRRREKGARLLSAIGLRVAGTVFVAWTAFVVWAAIATHAPAYLLLALPTVPLAVVTFRLAAAQTPQQRS